VTRIPWSTWRGRFVAGRQSAMRQVALLIIAVMAVGGTTLVAAPAQAAPANDLEYNYTYFLASSPPTTPQAVTRMALDDFDSFFPFQGCPNVVAAGTICPLEGPNGNNPIRVEAADATSFTFRSLPGHVEGADRMIKFTFFMNGSEMDLNVHSWGPWTAGAVASINGGVAAATWQAFAFNLQSGISNGTYNDFPGVNATVNSNPFSSPVVASDADGRLEAFVMDPGGTIDHDYQTTAGGHWSGWSALGPGGLYGGPAIGTNKDGRLEIFAIGSDYTLQHDYQKTPNGSWNGWSGLGNDGHDLLYVKAAADADGLLQVLALDDEGHVLVDRQASNGAWTWSDLGGGSLLSPPAIGRNADGRLEVFVLDGNYQVEHAWETSANGPWSGFSSMGGYQLHSDPAVGTNPDGRLEVFGRGTDWSLDHIYQTSPNAGWSSWSELGGGITSAPTVINNSTGKLQVFALTESGSVNYDNSASGSWVWGSLGGTLGSVAAPGRDVDGRLEVVSVGLSGDAFDIWQTSPNGNWSSWAGL
jgi:hypothetical protein